jgi:DNA repair protein RecO (recombination protein O)
VNTSEALIIRTVDFSETSIIVSAFTQQYGKIEALAKGGRRLKGQFESSLDLLARNSVTFIPKRGDVLDLLTESKLIRRFRVSPLNLAGVLGGQYVAELIDAFTQPHDPQPAIYDLAVKVLPTLESGKLVMRTLIRFEGRFLRAVGLLPSLRVCVNCGAAVSYEPSRRIMFGHHDGGVFCTNCFQGQPHIVGVSAEALSSLEKLIDPQDRREHWKTLPIDRNISGEIRNLLNQYIAHRLGWRPKLFDWWKMIAAYER